MGVSGTFNGAENNLDEYERRLRAGRVRAAIAEDAGLLDLARRLAPERSSPDDQAASAPDRRDADSMRAPDATTLETTVAFVPVEPGGCAARARRAPRLSGFGVASSLRPCDAGRAPGRRLGGWTAVASALAPAGAALFGAAMVIAVFASKGGSPGAPEAEPVIAQGQGPAEAPQPSGETIAAKGDVDATRLNVIAPVKVVGSEKRPTNLDSDASPAPMLPSAPPAGTSGGPSVAAPATPVAAVEVAALPPAASPSPDSTPQRTASAPPQAIEAASAADAGDPRIKSGGAPPAAPQRAAAPAPAAETKVVPVAQPTAPKLDSRAKLLRRTSVRVTAAKTGAASLGAAAERLGERQRPEASAAPTPAQPQAAPAPAAPQEPINPVTHAFGALAGALGAPTADQTASKSGDWAIQFAAPKSQAEAEAAAARLNAKYAGALNGATIGVHKTEVNGETIYALRVAGLSKAEAAALCVRVKGRDCSIVK